MKLCSEQFAAQAIGVMLLILKEYYSDAEIKKMLTRKKIADCLDILNKRGAYQ
jgi:hypothetical protein